MFFLNIQKYDFEIEHRAGEKIKYVDALSRNPISNISRIVLDVCDCILTLQMQEEEIILLKESLGHLFNQR